MGASDGGGGLGDGGGELGDGGGGGDGDVTVTAAAGWAMVVAATETAAAETAGWA